MSERNTTIGALPFDWKGKAETSLRHGEVKNGREQPTPGSKTQARKAGFAAQGKKRKAERRYKKGGGLNTAWGGARGTVTFGTKGGAKTGK